MSSALPPTSVPLTALHLRGEHSRHSQTIGTVSHRVAHRSGDVTDGCWEVVRCGTRAREEWGLCECACLALPESMMGASAAGRCSSRAGMQDNARIALGIQVVLASRPQHSRRCAAAGLTGAFFWSCALAACRRPCKAEKFAGLQPVKLPSSSSRRYQLCTAVFWRRVTRNAPDEYVTRPGGFRRACPWWADHMRPWAVLACCCATAGLPDWLPTLY